MDPVIEIKLSRLIWLFELAIINQERCQKEDSSWNYGIEELKKELAVLKRQQELFS